MRRAAWLWAAAAVAAAPSAGAADEEVLRWSVEGRITHDDNVFRLSDQQDTQAALGTGHRGDTSQVLRAAIALDLPVRRQRLQAAWAMNSERFERFGDLDFTGHEGRATWLWQLGERWRGRLEYQESSVMAPFTDIQARAPDVLDTRQGQVEAIYALTPRWQVQGNAARLHQRNGDPQRVASDIDQDSGGIEVAYVTFAGDRASLAASREEGRFPAREESDPFGRSYRQDSAGARAQWALGGATRTNLRIDHVRRRYDSDPVRSYEGTTFRLGGEWRPGAKTTVEAAALRDISPYEAVLSTFVLVRAVTLRVAYAATEKLALEGTYLRGKREFPSDPASVPASGGEARLDRLEAASLGLSWKATGSITVKLGVRHEERTSNAPLADYGFTSATASVAIAF